MKRLVGLLMCMVFVIGCLAGCETTDGGASTEAGFGVGDEGILLEAINKVNTAKSCDMEMKLNGKITMNMSGESMALDTEMISKSTTFDEPYKMKMVTLYTIMGESTESEIYIEKDKDKYLVYKNAENSWTKMEVKSLKEALANAGLTIIAESYSENIQSYTKKEDRTENEKTYLVYEYTITKEELQKMKESLQDSLIAELGNPEDETLAKQMQEYIPKMLDGIETIPMTILIDREEKSIYRVECSLTDMFNKMLKVAVEWIGEYAKSSITDEEYLPYVEEELKDMSFTASDMKMKISYSNLNEVEDFEIPEEAKNAEFASDIAA